MPLRYERKGINATMGSEGTIDSMKVVRNFPTFQIGKVNNREQGMRMEVKKETRGEMEILAVGLRVSAALKDRIPPATKYEFLTGQRERVYSKNSRRWEGPFNINNIE